MTLIVTEQKVIRPWDGRAIINEAYAEGIAPRS
jgi:hypothetical protein